MTDKSSKDNNQKPLEELIPLAEAAKISGLSQAHLRLLVRTGKVWGTKIGRNWVTTTAAVKTYLDTDPHPGRKPKE